MPYDWRKPNRLPNLQIGDTAQEQVVFPASVILITNLPKANKLGITVRKLRSAEAVYNCDNARSLVTIGELAKYGELQKIAPSDFDKYTYPHACVIEGDEVLTLAKRRTRDAEKFGWGSARSVTERLLWETGRTCITS